MEERYLFTRISENLKHRERGFTLVELIVVLATLGILIALSVPRYLASRKNAYKAEAYNILQEVKMIEWAYYQEFNDFTTNLTRTGFLMPGGSHWATPVLSTFVGQGEGDGQVVFNVMILTSGIWAPVGAADQVSIVLNGDGRVTAGASF